ncbi:MAG: hypothetical protein U9R34_00105 [Nanoarchaeota archaeon]|nr:hypothetical protein [Nanoarchaeota archaeon]
MNYFKSEKLSQFNLSVDRISKVLTGLDYLISERPYFSYDPHKIRFFFEKQNPVYAEVDISCNLLQTRGDDLIEVCFNNSHAHINIGSDNNGLAHSLEAQEFIRCSSKDTADKVEYVLKEIAGNENKSCDYIFNIMGDRLRFDRKGNCFRGWTGGYDSLEPQRILEYTKETNEEWHNQNLFYNLSMRLDALYFLNELINENINAGIEEKTKQFIIGKIGGNQTQKAADEKLCENLSMIDPLQYELLNEIKYFLKSETGQNSVVNISTDHLSCLYPEENSLSSHVLGSNPELFFVLNNSTCPFMRYGQFIKSGDLEDEQAIKGSSNMKKNELYRTEHHGLDIIIDPSLKDGIEIVAERWDIKDYSYHNFIRDYHIFQDFKKTLINHQKI